MTRNPDLQHVGIKMPAALKMAMTTTAQRRGVTVSELVRAAVARDLAQVPNPRKPAQSAQ